METPGTLILTSLEDLGDGAAGKFEICLARGKLDWSAVSLKTSEEAGSKQAPASERKGEDERKGRSWETRIRGTRKIWRPLENKGPSRPSYIPPTPNTNFFYNIFGTTWVSIVNTSDPFLVAG